MLVPSWFSIAHADGAVDVRAVREFDVNSRADLVLDALQNSDYRARLYHRAPHIEQIVFVGSERADYGDRLQF